MFKIIKQGVDAFINLSAKENMEDKEQGIINGLSQDVISIFLIFLIILFLVFILGKFCWNNYLVEAVPGLNPLTSITQFIAIWFVAQTLFTK